MNALFNLRSAFIKIIGNGFQTNILKDPWLFALPLNPKPTYINPSSIPEGASSTPLI